MVESGVLHPIKWPLVAHAVVLLNAIGNIVLYWSASILLRLVIVEITGLQQQPTDIYRFIFLNGWSFYQVCGLAFFAAVLVTATATWNVTFGHDFGGETARKLQHKVCNSIR